MGFLGLGKKKHRGPTRTGADRKAAMDAKEKELVINWIKELKRDNPSTYNQIMAQRANMNVDQTSDLDRLLGTLGKLQKAGLIDDPKAAANRGWLRDLAPMLPGVLGALQGGAGMFTPPTQQNQYQPPPGYRLVPTEPAPAPTPDPPAEISAAETLETGSIVPEQPAEESFPSMSPLSVQMINVISPMTPQQAAEYLVQQKVPFAKALVNTICQTPDEQIPDLLKSVAADVPDIGGFMFWLRNRPQWLAELVQALRLLKGVSVQPVAHAG